MALGHEVLAIDNYETQRQRDRADVTHAVELDASDERRAARRRRRRLRARDRRHLEQHRGEHLRHDGPQELGVANVIAKAATALHGRILERVGRDRVVYAEREMGARVAHSFSIRTSSTTSTSPRGSGSSRSSRRPHSLAETLRELDLPGAMSLTPIALRRGKNVTVNPHRDERIEATDELILIGRDEKLTLLGE